MIQPTRIVFYHLIKHIIHFYNQLAKIGLRYARLKILYAYKNLRLIRTS